MTILTTGVGSGIGRFLHEQLGGVGWSRTSPAPEEREALRIQGVDVIIHCALNSRRTVTSDVLYQYLDDNVFLTRELVRIPHRKFIFFSTASVYPRDGRIHTEDLVIDAEAMRGIYELTKLMSESIVQRWCANSLILRPTGLLGIYARRYSLIKIIEDGPCVLSLAAHSRFDYILYADVLSLIRQAIDQDFTGIYNVASSGSITLSEVAAMVGKHVTFGEYLYDIGATDNSKVLALAPVFGRTSRENVQQFLTDRNVDLTRTGKRS